MFCFGTEKWKWGKSENLNLVFLDKAVCSSGISSDGGAVKLDFEKSAKIIFMQKLAEIPTTIKTFTPNLKWN